MNNIMNTIIKKNEPIVIGVDHGFGNIKTAHCCFRTGVTVYCILRCSTATDAFW